MALDYDTMPAVLDAREALAADTPRLWEGRTNETATLEGAYGDVSSAFSSATHVVELELAVGRRTAVPMETRGLVAPYDRSREHLEIWGMTKVPHYNRRMLATALDIPLNHIHLRGCDASGGFGIRDEFYPDDFLVPYLARRLERPVKWVEDGAPPSQPAGP